MPGCPSSHQHWQAEAGFLLTPPGPCLPFSFGPLSSSCVTAAVPGLSCQPAAGRVPGQPHRPPSSRSGERPAPRPPCPSEHTDHAQAYTGMDSDPDLKELCGSLSVEGAGGKVAGWGLEPTPARNKQRWKDRPEALAGPPWPGPPSLLPRPPARCPPAAFTPFSARLLHSSVRLATSCSSCAQHISGELSP